MRVNSSAVALSAGLLLATIVTSLLVLVDHQRVEASFLDTLKSPFKKVYYKARDWRDRHSSRSDRSPTYPASGGRIDNRFAGPANEEIAPRVSTSRTPAGRSAASSSSADDTSDFKSQCFLARGPNFKKPPKLFFYAAKTHAPDTFGCDTDRTPNFELKPVDGDISDSPNLNTTVIREALFDTHLYDVSAPTYIVIHGFMASWNSDNWMCQIKDLVLNSTSANVFIVDWSGGAKPMLPIDYSSSVSNTQYVGALLGELINVLVSMTGQQDATQFHMIGHSLGAHICGFAGYYVNSLGRITGLDPAGPCFGSGDSGDAQEVASGSGFLDRSGKRRLSPESANFVVALHTDTALFGLNENCAHYDVYVNGGYKQPKCGSNSLRTRFSDLIHLNLQDTFDLNIGCAHSYAHKLVDTFINFISPLDQRFAIVQQQQQQQLDWVSHHENHDNQQQISDLQRSISGLVVNGEDHHQRSAAEKCYPIAYACANWDLFKAGECGFCRDNDTRCVYTGLSTFQYQIKKSNFSDPRGDQNQSADNASIGDNNNDDDDDDDDQFNDEGADSTSGDQAPTADKTTELSVKPNTRYSSGQHFIRTGENGVCLYHYQIIVAARQSDIDAITNAPKYYYYLDLPLELSGRLTDAEGNRLHDRLVQVSHRLKPESAAHKHLQTSYINALRHRQAHVSYDSRDNIDFYTTLITFRMVRSDDCQTDETNGAAREKNWQICKPLDNIQEARLWSSSAEKLDAVVWVGLNYMSGMSYDMRMDGSYVLNRNLGVPVMSRDEVSKADRPKLKDLDPKKGRSLGNIVNGAAKTTDCLLSLFDLTDTTNTKRNFKCDRSGAELKYAIKLDPKKLANNNLR